MMALAGRSAGTQPVWSLGLRLLHWTLAASMIASFVTHEGGGGCLSPWLPFSVAGGDIEA